jgi:glycosyltransferase involved in cell wall biosynthesis
LPLIASWHTNIHEFATCRLDQWMAWLPRPLRSHLVCSAERFCLSAALRFYRIAKLLFAPNQELIQLLGERTGKPVYPMARGVHTDRFSPAFRSRNDDAFVLGYAGRLRPEKHVRALSEIEDALVAAGENQYRFLIVGDGSERDWLQSHLLRAEFTGFLEGEALAQAFANMDLFVFPSETDTYGNVIQEAMASGVPVLVTDKGGPKALVSPGTTGYIASDIEGFCSAIRRLMHDASLHSQMRQAARRQACRMSWDRVFEELYMAYGRLNDRAASTPILAGPKGGDSRSRSDALAAG